MRKRWIFTAICCAVMFAATTAFPEASSVESTQSPEGQFVVISGNSSELSGVSAQIHTAVTLGPMDALQHFESRYKDAFDEANYFGSGALYTGWDRKSYEGEINKRASYSGAWTVYNFTTTGQKSLVGTLIDNSEDPTGALYNGWDRKSYEDEINKRASFPGAWIVYNFSTTGQKSLVGTLIDNSEDPNSLEEEARNWYKSVEEKAQQEIAGDETYSDLAKVLDALNGYSSSEIPVGSKVPTAANETIENAFSNNGTAAESNPSITSNSQSTDISRELYGENVNNELYDEIENWGQRYSQLPRDLRPPLSLDVDVDELIKNLDKESAFPEPTIIERMVITGNPEGGTDIQFSVSKDGKTNLYQYTTSNKLLVFSNLDIEQLRMTNPGSGTVISFADSVEIDTFYMDGNLDGMVCINGKFTETTVDTGNLYVSSKNGGTVSLIHEHSSLMTGGEGTNIYRVNTLSGLLEQVEKQEGVMIGTVEQYVDLTTVTPVPDEDDNKDLNSDIPPLYDLEDMLTQAGNTPMTPITPH